MEALKRGGAQQTAQAPSPKRSQSILASVSTDMDPFQHQRVSVTKSEMIAKLALKDQRTWSCDIQATISVTHHRANRLPTGILERLGVSRCDTGRPSKH